MRNAFAPSVFGLAAIFGAAAIVVACSSKTDDSEFQPPGDKDAQDGPISNLLIEGGPDSGKDGPAGSCSPAVPMPFTPTWVAPAPGASACTTVEIKGYYDACLVNAGVTEQDGTCTAYKAAHKPCTDCAEPANKSGPVQWHVARNFYTINTAACIAVAQKGLDGGGNGCGEAYNAAAECTRESCVSCITVAKSFPKFIECQREVGNRDLCKEYEDGKSPKCDGYRDPGSPAIPCFPTSNAEDQLPYFTRVITLMCGPP